MKDAMVNGIKAQLPVIVEVTDVEVVKVEVIAG